MSQLKNFVSGLGRLNRRQFLVMFILTSLCLGMFLYILDIILLILLGEENFVIPALVKDFVLEIFVGLPIALAYFIRRGHDFGVKSSLSALFVILLSVLYVLPGIWDLLGENSIFLVRFNITVVLIYIFYPGNKTANKYGEVPVDSGRPGRILRYMRTGSWENKLN